MAARPTLAARAARRTARTAPPREAPATYPPPARTAEPTTARRNGGQRPVPMAPPLAAVGAPAPRALTANPTPASAKAERQPAPMAPPLAAVGARAPRRLRPILLQRAPGWCGSRSQWRHSLRQSEHERHGAYGQSYSSERQGGAVANPYGSAAYGSRNTSATGLTANLTPASVKVVRWPTPMAPPRTAVGARAPRALMVNLTPASVKAGRWPTPMAPPRTAVGARVPRALMVNLTPASVKAGRWPTPMAPPRTAVGARAPRRLWSILLRRASRRGGGQPLWRCGWR